MKLGFDVDYYPFAGSLFEVLFLASLLLSQLNYSTCSPDMKHAVANISLTNSLLLSIRSSEYVLISIVLAQGVAWICHILAYLSGRAKGEDNNSTTTTQA